MDYSAYKDLKVRLLEPGILEIAMGEEGKLAVATENAHAEMARIWLDVDRDPQARVAILRGARKGVSAGGARPAGGRRDPARRRQGCLCRRRPRDGGEEDAGLRPAGAGVARGRLRQRNPC